MLKFNGRALWCATLLSACGCSALNDAASVQEASSAWIGDVRDNVTSVHEIISKLGGPTATYDDGKILVYRLLIRPDGLVLKGSVPRAMHGNNPINERWLADHRELDFVAVCDEKGTIVRHTLLKTFDIWATR